MEPLITNRLDPALLRVIEKRANDRESASRRRRPSSPEKSPDEETADTNAAAHEVDDLA